MIAFVVGSNYTPGNGCAIIASHIDALTTKVKPISTKPTALGYVQLGIANYGGVSNLRSLILQFIPCKHAENT